MATRIKPKPNVGKPEISVVVLAQGMFDDFPLRVFTSRTPRADANEWATKLAKSADTVDEMIRSLCARIGWASVPTASYLTLIVYERGIPLKVLSKIPVAEDPPKQQKSV